MLGSHCIQNPPSLSSRTNEAGTVGELEGLKTYITGPPDSRLAMLLIADIFGFEALNLRKLADKVAASTGFLVVVPDLLYGDYYDLDKPQFDPKSWLKAHREDKGCKDTKPLIAALKSKGISAIGVAGFCWGGTVAAKLANSNDIQAAVVLHPGPTTNGDINDVKVPIAILAAEIDEFCPAEQVKQFAEMLALKSDQFDSFVKIYPGVVHG